MILAVSPLGKQVEIVKTPRDDALKRRLESLGILAGRRLTPLGESSGGLILKIGDSKIAINRELAMKIAVR